MKYRATGINAFFQKGTEVEIAREHIRPNKTVYINITNKKSSTKQSSVTVLFFLLEFIPDFTEEFYNV